MKIWLKSWRRRACAAKASRRAGRGAGRVGVVGHVARAAGRAARAVRRALAALGGADARGRNRGSPRRPGSGRCRAGTGSAGNARRAPRTTPLVFWVSTSPSTSTLKFVERPVGGEHVGDVAERVLLLVEPRVRRHVDAPAHHVLAVVVARRQPQHLDHAGGRRIVAIVGAVGDADAHSGIGSAISDHDDGTTRIDDIDAVCPADSDLTDLTPGHSRYCCATAVPRRLLSSTNSSMNSCRPLWKISSMRLFSSRARTARAWRCAGPWRP